MSTAAGPAPAGEAAELSSELSPRAWMSRRDAALAEAVLVRAYARLDRPVHVLEWGSGLSTLSFTAALRERGIPYDWTTVEHDRAWFDAELRDRLSRVPGAVIRYDSGGEVRAPAGPHALEARVFDGPRILPWLPGREAERAADLDAYVTFPASLGAAWDVVFVDGRKRRRCLLEAARLLAPGGIVLLHDAHRTWYHCAFDAYVSYRRIGDEYWIGCPWATDFRESVPGHAFLPSGVHPSLDFAPPAAAPGSPGAPVVHAWRSGSPAR